MNKELYKVLVSLNNVCKKQHSLYKTYPPKVNLEVRSNDLVSKEIKKVIHYLEYPQYSYLSK